ncbi:hypothetical protein BDF19DRAFT_13541 [Syncephalis fuscata]|nr:hypothetical protein BDF19DRAFT_13541 [Syncephalis fuscata]
MKDDTYLTPVMEEDALLYAFENLDVGDNMSMRSGMTGGSRRHHMLSEGNILDRLYAAEAKLASRERELQR